MTRARDDMDAPGASPTSRMIRELAAEVLRTTTLNAAIQSEASATSDLPTLERAVKAMRCDWCCEPSERARGLDGDA